MNKQINLMTPYEEPSTVGEVAFNKHHKKCCCSIERAIGVLKSRFRCICRQSDGAIPFDNEVLCTVIMSCIVLHNYCRVRNMDWPLAADIAEDIRKERSSTGSGSLLIKRSGRSSDESEGPQDGYGQLFQIIMYTFFLIHTLCALTNYDVNENFILWAPVCL